MGIKEDVEALEKRISLLETGATKTADVLYQEYAEETLPAGKYGEVEVSYD